MKNIRAIAFVAAAGVLAVPNLAKAQAAGDETFQPFVSIVVPNLKSFDISWVDPNVGFYFLADRSNASVDLINTTTKQFGQYFAGNFAGNTGNNNTSGPDGLLTLRNPANGNKTEIWVGDGPHPNAVCPTQAPFNGSCSTVKVLDFDTGTLTHTIATNTATQGIQRADELCWDPADRLILVANDADTPPYITFISTDTYHPQKQILIPEATNGIEQCQYDTQTGLFFLNIPEVNGPGDDTADGAVYVIDPTSLTITGKYVVNNATCAGPQGMAIGPSPQLLLGCNAQSKASGGLQSSVIINKFNGAPLAVAFGLGGADEVWFNARPGDQHYYITGASCVPNTCFSGTNTQLAFVDAVTGGVDQVIALPNRVTTGASPHSVAADPRSNEVYVPQAGQISIFFPTAKDSDD